MTDAKKIIPALHANWLLNALGLVVSFAASVVLVRLISPELFAQYAAVLAIAGVATLVFEAGANSGLTRYMREAPECGAAGTFYLSMQRRRWAAAIICAVAVVLLGPIYARSTQLGGAASERWVFICVGVLVAATLTKLLAHYGLLALFEAKTALLLQQGILTKTPAERDEVGLDLRAQVERLHSLPRLVGRILDLLADNSVLGSRLTMATESPATHQPACHQPRRRIGSDGEKSHLRNQTRVLSVLYLFTRSRGALLDRVLRGEDHGNNFWGMLQLPRHGVAASYTELEKYLPKTIAEFLRTRVLRPHFVHAPLFFELFSYDLVFTSTGFGTQLVHTLLPLRKPRWVMHDFSISSLLGEERTLKQRMFAWMVSRSDGIVTLSRSEQELLSNRFPHLRNRIAFIPFGVDLSYFKPLPAEEVREIFVPGTDPDRDYLTLFEAATGLGVPVVVTTRPDRLARLASIPSFVERKWFAPADLLLEYSRAQVVVIPLNTKSGLNDAMGLQVLQESLAMGKAIIATRTVTTESFITDGMNGLLVEEGNVEALRSALDRLLTDTALRSRLGHAARQFAEEHLDSDRQTAKLASFFIGLVESRCEPSCCELAATADSVEGTTIRSGRIEVPRES